MNDALDQRPKDVNSLEEMRHGRLRGGQERQLRVERAQEFLLVNDIDDTVHVCIFVLHRTLPLGERR